jgi:hypothetical protein
MLVSLYKQRAAKGPTSRSSSAADGPSCWHLPPQGNGDRPAVVFDVFRYRFATLVFASWDYHLTDHAAAANLRRSIRQQLREMLNDAADDDVHVTVLARFTAQIRKVSTDWSVTDM